MFGTSCNLLDLNLQAKQNVDAILMKKLDHKETFRQLLSYTQGEHRVCYVIYPDSATANSWSAIMAVALSYTALLMPYRMAFTDLVFWDFWSIAELIVDLLFCVDILFNFFTAYTKGGIELETRLRVISVKYFTTWFLLDLIACIPFSLIDYVTGQDGKENAGSQYNTLLKLVRLPRLYKLLKIVRIIKILKHYKNSEALESILDFFRVNSRSYKLIKFLVGTALCVHISGCFWYYAARVEGFGPETWVSRNSFLNAPLSTQYLASIYWAFTTITTVGYGDIHPRTEIELLFTLFWMILGIGFYSIIIGSFTSLLSEIDTREAFLSSKLLNIQEFAAEAGVSDECKKKMKEVIKYNFSKAHVVSQDKYALFKELPRELRYEIAITMFQGIAKDIPFFKNKDIAFVVEVMPLFHPLQFEDSQFIYKENEYAADVYIISKGRVNAVLNIYNAVYKSFLKGSYFGDTEILLHIEQRIESVQACGTTELISVGRKALLGLLEDFPKISSEMQTLAQIKFKKSSQEKLITREFIEKAKNREKPNVSELVDSTMINESTDNAEEQFTVHAPSFLPETELTNLTRKVNSIEDSLRTLEDGMRKLLEMKEHRQYR